MHIWRVALFLEANETLTPFKPSFFVFVWIYLHVVSVDSASFYKSCRERKDITRVMEEESHRDARNVFSAASACMESKIPCGKKIKSNLKTALSGVSINQN